MSTIAEFTRENAAFYQSRRVFVTGHTGFKGAWLTAILHELSAEATGYALPPEPGALFEKMDGAAMLRSVTGDVRDSAALCRAMAEAQPEIVFHLAAQVPARECFEHPRTTYETNVMGAVNLLEAVRQCPSVKSVVVVTTDKVYLNRGDGTVYGEEDPLGGNDPYSSSKTCTEYITEAYRQSYLQTEQRMVGTSTVRASNVLGGGDHVQSRLIPSILNAVAEGRPVELRNPRQTRPWQSVLDALNGYLTVGRLMYLEPRRFSSQWNIGPEAGGIRDVLWVMEKIQAYYDVGYAPGQPLEVKESQTLGLDITKAKRLLGWAPQLTAEETVSHVVSFFKSQQAGESERDLCARQVREYFGLGGPRGAREPGGRTDLVMHPASDSKAPMAFME